MSGTIHRSLILVSGSIDENALPCNRHRQTLKRRSGVGERDALLSYLKVPKVTFESLLKTFCNVPVIAHSNYTKVIPSIPHREATASSQVAGRLPLTVHWSHTLTMCESATGMTRPPGSGGEAAAYRTLVPHLDDAPVGYRNDPSAR